MVRYYQTTGLYSITEDSPQVDLLKFEVRYNKAQGGYIAQLYPCTVDKYGEGRHYCPEYFECFGSQFVALVQSSRRSAKKEAEAIKMVEEKDVIDMLIDHYMAYAASKGKTFEIICELEELRG
jgi:Zn-finger protein